MTSPPPSPHPHPYPYPHPHPSTNLEPKELSDRQVLLLLLEMFVEALGEYQRVCEDIHIYSHHDLAHAPVLPDLAHAPVPTDLAHAPGEATFSPLHERQGLGEGNRDRGRVLSVDEGNEVDGSNVNANDDNLANHTTIIPASLFNPGSGEDDMDSPPSCPVLLAGGLSPVRTHKDKGSTKGQGSDKSLDIGSDKEKEKGKGRAGEESPPRSHRPTSPTPSSPVTSPRTGGVPGPSLGPGAVAVASPGAGAVTPGRSHTLSIKASLTHLRLIHPNNIT